MSRLTTLVQKVTGFLHKAEPMGDDPGWTIFGPSVPAWWDMGWWQKGYSSPATAKENTAVEACVGQYARTIAMLPVTHVKDLPDGGTASVTNSNVLRVLRKPNSYQTRADFILNLVRSELFTGNGYAVAIRSGFQISQLHLLPPTDSRHYVDPEDQAIYYQVSGNELVPGANLGNYLVPARDMLHIHMQTAANDPLRGETPLQAGLMAASAGSSIQKHNAAFFNNMSRPSGTLNTDLELDKDQSAALRKRWEDQSQGLNAGKTPVLSHGLKWNSLSITATDAEMIEFYKLTVGDIARIYGIPQALIGLMEASTLGNIETLLNMWVSTALGYMVDHIELALEVLFDLPSDEHINFNLDYIMRGDLAQRMDALSKGVLGGIYAPDEARAKEGLKPVPGGDEVRLQQQNVPLSWWDKKLKMDQERLDMEQESLEQDPVDNSSSSTDSAQDEKSFDPVEAIKMAMK